MRQGSLRDGPFLKSVSKPRFLPILGDPLTLAEEKASLRAGGFEKEEQSSGLPACSGNGILIEMGFGVRFTESASGSDGIDAADWSPGTRCRSRAVSTP